MSKVVELQAKQYDLTQQIKTLRYGIKDGCLIDPSEIFILQIELQTVAEKIEKIYTRLGLVLNDIWDVTK